MGLVWSGYGAIGFLAMFVAIAMASFVYFAAPGGHAANRRLALILLLEGFAVGAGNGLIYMVDQPHLASASQAVSITAVLALPAAYLAFLATLDSPLVKPLKTRPAEVLLVLAGIGSVLAFFLYPRAFLVGVEPAWYATYDAILGEAYRAFGLYVRLPILLFAFVVAVDGVYRAKTTIGRRRAKAFAVAFGFGDAFRLITSFLFLAIIPAMSGTNVVAVAGNWLDLVGVVVYPVVMLIFVSLLAYGILRTQLFDIDVKIKFTISKGAIASAFLLVFFITAQVVEQFLGQTFGIVLGGVAAGGLFFLLSPIQKMAERVADRAMPGVKPVHQMDDGQRLELYKEQLEYAFADGNVSKKERMLLEHLRHRLGVERAEAQKVEKMVLRAAGFANVVPAPARA